LVDVARLPVVEMDGVPQPVPAAPSNTSDAPAPPSRDDIFALLERLADLHAKGILSAEEFAAKKAELLNRI